MLAFTVFLVLFCPSFTNSSFLLLHIWLWDELFVLLFPLARIVIIYTWVSHHFFSSCLNGVLIQCLMVIFVLYKLSFHQSFEWVVISCMHQCSLYELWSNIESSSLWMDCVLILKWRDNCETVADLVLSFYICTSWCSYVTISNSSIFCIWHQAWALLFFFLYTPC